MTLICIAKSGLRSWNDLRAAITWFFAMYLRVKGSELGVWWWVLPEDKRLSSFADLVGRCHQAPIIKWFHAMHPWVEGLHLGSRPCDCLLWYGGDLTRGVIGCM